MSVIRCALLALTLIAATQSGTAQEQPGGGTAFTVKRYAALDNAWNTNAYFVESDTGIVIIDTQMLPSDIKLFAAMIKATGKPVKGMIITHAHYDHFIGIAPLRETLGDFPVYATQETIDAMPQVHREITGFYREIGGEKVYENFMLPDTVIRGGDKVKIAGITFHVDHVGASESPDNIMLFQPDLNVLFAGDLFYPNIFYYVREGRSGKILSILKSMKKKYAGVNMVYSGHGNPARMLTVDGQIAHISLMRKLVKDALADPKNIVGKGRLTRVAFQKIVSTFLAAYPYYDDSGLPRRGLTASNVGAVIREMVAETGHPQK